MSTYRPSVESPIPRDTYVLETDGDPPGRPGPSPFRGASRFYAGRFDLILETVKYAETTSQVTPLRFNLQRAVVNSHNEV